MMGQAISERLNGGSKAELEKYQGRTGASEIKKIIRKCKAETKAINRLDDEQKEFLERLRFDGEERERHKARPAKR
jgi:hypothetical protein